MDGYVGEVRFFAFNFTPENWLPCNGGFVAVMQFQALFSIVGHRFEKGTPSNTQFGLPNLGGRAVMGYGDGPGLTPRDTLGEVMGSNAVTLTSAQNPGHSHVFQLTYPDAVPSPATAAPAPGSTITAPFADDASGSGVYSNCFTHTMTTPLASRALNPAGSSASHENRQPLLSLTACICAIGEYPVNPD